MGVPANEIVRAVSVSNYETDIRRFRRLFRRRLRKLVTTHPAYGDLLTAFPAAAIALISDHATLAQRQRAHRMVRQGDPLKLVATALALPLWTRKLPPEAFVDGVPQWLPLEAEVGRRLSGLVPQDPDKVCGWLNAVADAWHYGGEDFALWIARNPELYAGGRDASVVQLLAVYAWYSERPALPATKLMERRWTDRMGIRAASQGAVAWLQEVTQDVMLGANGLNDCWLSSGRAAGYRFVALQTLDDLKAEAVAMDNCIGDYANALTRDHCRLFSIRRGSQRVATVEVRPHPHHPRKPTIVQLYGPGNDDAPDRVWAAAFTWLGRQTVYELPDFDPEANKPLPNRQAWMLLWRPYWRDVGDHPLLARSADGETLPMMMWAARRAYQRAR